MSIKNFLLIFLLLSCQTVVAGIDLQSLASGTKIVTACKKIEFNNFREAHNPSLIKIEQGFLLIFRYRPDPQFQPWISCIGIVELDNSLEPTSKPYLLNTRPKNSKTPSQAEDARFFVYRNRLFLIYNDNVDVVAPGYSDRRDMFIAELSHVNDTYELSTPLKLYYEPDYRSILWQKNWTPFEYDGKLLLSYSLIPHLIICPNLLTGGCYPYHETRMHIGWQFGTLRGSSQAILVDGEYWSFFHSGIKTSSDASFGWDLWHYFMGAYAFAATPPFAITRMTAKPIVTEGFYTISNREKRVIFPGGFAVSGETIYLACGKDDCEIWIMTIDKQELIKAMNPI